MLYETYQWHDDMLAPIRRLARSLGNGHTRHWPVDGRGRRHMAAGLEMLASFELTHQRPEFGIASVPVGNREVPVSEEVALDLPFGRLLHFAKDIDTPQPRVLVVAPLSGHFATLLRETVATLLRDHDVYITDWVNARDVPTDAGSFGVEDHIAYLIRYLEAIGPGAHVLAVCQPCVQTLAAVAVMSQDRHPATPRSMTLMAGPIDTRESPTAVNKLATGHPLAWFERNVIARVPGRYAGGGRRVYPGFLQLSAFMSMNATRHRDMHRKLYRLLAQGEKVESKKIKDFYAEYFAVLDLTEEFYIETIDRIFQRAELAEGTFTYRGRPVDPGAIRHTALLTVEGGRDDICALGQTAAAHDLCRSLRPHLRRHHLQANSGHYGVFSGRRWEREIYPVVRNMILAME
jgi:polyhydroxyalkanoate depolymerase